MRRDALPEIEGWFPERGGGGLLRGGHVPGRRKVYTQKKRFRLERNGKGRVPERE